MSTTNQSDYILHELESLSDSEKKIFLPHFFKTGKGEYGEGDKFLGVVVPKIREVAKRHKDVSFDIIAELLSSEWHEVRMCALLILVMRFNKADENTRNEIYRFYLLHTSSINNWDLVDLSAPGIVGANLSAKGADERQELYRLAESSNLWEQRIAIVSTITFIRNGEFDDTLQLAKIMMHHPHDLMHKAIGWMLREVGKRDKAVLTSFLNDYSLEMPRTMLRYAIEKFDEEERQYYLKKK